MAEKKIKTYITRDKKRNAIIAFCVVFVVFVVISLLELMPGNVTDMTQDDDMGVSRVQMFPFIFTDSNSDLYIINEEYEVTPVDDSVGQAVHDTSNALVYYLRESQLFEYDITTNSRRMLVDNCAFFNLFEDKSVIFTVDLNNDAYLYLYKSRGPGQSKRRFLCAALCPACGGGRRQHGS